MGWNIRNARKAVGLNLEQLAFKAGTQKGSMSLIERGERSIDVSRLEWIAEALNVQAGALLEKRKGQGHSPTSVTQ